MPHNKETNDRNELWEWDPFVLYGIVRLLVECHRNDFVVVGDGVLGVA